MVCNNSITVYCLTRLENFKPIGENSSPTLSRLFEQVVLSVVVHDGVTIGRQTTKKDAINIRRGNFLPQMILIK
jgi:hypothetical protein